jgi:hypothetical protein
MVIYNQMSEQFPNYQPEQWRTEPRPLDEKEIKSKRVEVKPILERHKKDDLTGLSELSQSLIKSNK